MVTLSQLKEQHNRLTDSYLWEAYKVIVKKIRLDFIFLPVFVEIDTSAVGFEIDDFENTLTDVNGVEIAVKQIRDFHGVVEENSYNGAYGVGEVYVGDPNISDYGFPNFSQVNNIHTIEPKIVRKNTLNIITNPDDFEETNAFFWISGYFYPYFAYPVASGDIADDAEYDFTGKENDNYVVDPSLMFMVTAKAMALISRDEDNIELSTSWDAICDSYIKIYNRNLAPRYAKRFSPLGEVECPDM